jgi:predicted amidohydrolase
MKVAGVQLDIAWHDREANYKKVRDLGARAAAAGAHLLVLPEMFATGFSMEVSVTAEAPDGPTANFMRELARELQLTVVGGLVISGQRGRPKNCALAVGPDGQDLALYAKIHPIALLGEDRHYDPGDLPCPFTYGGAGMSCFVCYDLRFPELFRTVVDRVALILVIASWPSSRQIHWDVLLRARAIESQCFVVGVNRVGEGGGYSFTGGSCVVDPMGNVLAQGGGEEALVMAEIDLSEVERVRETMPFLRDRRQHLFEILAKR